MSQDWRDELVQWLEDNPSAVPLPKNRTTEQWLAWLRAEGFIDEIERFGYFDVGTPQP